MTVAAERVVGSVAVKVEAKEAEWVVDLAAVKVAVRAELRAAVRVVGSAAVKVVGSAVEKVEVKEVVGLVRAIRF